MKVYIHTCTLLNARHHLCRSYQSANYCKCVYFVDIEARPYYSCCWLWGANWTMMIRIASNAIILINRGAWWQPQSTSLHSLNNGELACDMYSTQSDRFVNHIYDNTKIMHTTAAKQAVRKLGKRNICTTNSFTLQNTQLATLDIQTDFLLVLLLVLHNIWRFKRHPVLL